MIEAVALQAYDLWSGGGIVMPALFTNAFVLWFALGDRWLRLRAGARRASGLRAARGQVVPGLDETLAEIDEERRAHERLVACLVAMAPLLGLLGTVTGLIETFGSLGASSTSTASEGIAGGIVEALYATQMGLAIAVPGLLAGGYLKQRARDLRVELDELRAILGGRRSEEAA